MARPSPLGFSTLDKGRQGGFPEAMGAQGTDPPVLTPVAQGGDIHTRHQPRFCPPASKAGAPAHPAPGSSSGCRAESTEKGQRVDKDLPARTEAAAHSRDPWSWKKTLALPALGAAALGAKCLGVTLGEVAPAEVCFPECKTGQRYPDRLPSAGTQCLGMQVGPGGSQLRGSCATPSLPH